jgi:hypothetical protein
MAAKREGETMITNHANAGGAMLRRVAALVAGLAMTASVGLIGVGSASAASPTSINNGSHWTLEVNGGTCEIFKFSTTNHTFSTTEFGGDNGKWSVPAPNKVKMKWTGGNDAGLTFKGTYHSSVKEYSGSFGGIGFGLTGLLVKGSVPGC